jgi:hypothetical protein
MRGQTRRIAAAPTTVAAVILSPIAINAIFTEASAQNSTAVAAITAQPSAVAAVCLSLNALVAIESNAISFNFLVESASFESNVKNAVAVSAGVNPATFSTMSALIANSVARTAVTSSVNAIKLIVASTPSVTLLAADTTGMSQVANNPVAIRLITASSSAMSVVANQPIAMAEITPVADAMSAIANSVPAITAVFSSGAAWTAFKAAGSNYIAVVPAVVYNLAGLTGAFPTLSSIIDNPAALTKVNANGGASEALATNAAALVYLATSPNFAAVAGNATIMNALAANTAATTALAGHPNLTVAANNPVAIGILTSNAAAVSLLVGGSSTDATRAAMFASSGARGAMFTSEAIVAAIASTPATVSWLKVNKGVVTTGTTVPNGMGRVGAFDPYGGGVPAKLLMLTATQIGIAAIPTEYQFKTGVAGAAKEAVLSLVGVAATAPDQNPTAHIATYSNLTVRTSVAVIAITGVTRITYVDMT